MTAPTLDRLTDLDAATHRRIGVALFNHVWTLLETPTGPRPSSTR